MFFYSIIILRPCLVHRCITKYPIERLFQSVYSIGYSLLLSKRLSDIVTSAAQLHVADSNERAMRLYQRAEFKDV